ncbi:MAG: hypothetical protein IJ097_04530 [Bacilli bacterium]|nr:hypothetical protein [Bacilli bacterium]
MIKCPHCGAEFKYNAKSKLVHCDYCGSDFNPKELKTKVKVSKKKENLLKGYCYSCTQCGATLMTFDETAITFCSYCGSQNMIEDKMIKETAPDVIIPFSKNQEECINNYKKKISSFLFAPGYMKSDMIVKKFRGIYMPYGLYKLEHHGDSINKGKKYSHRSGDYVYYDDYDIHAMVNATYGGISFDLLSKFYDEYSQSIPFNAKEAEEFNPNYLPGFYADSKDVDADTYYDDAVNVGVNDSSRFLKKDRIFSKYGCVTPKVYFNITEKKVGLFPLYFLAIKDKDNEHLHYAVINGQTGAVAADIPISFFKYILFSLIITVPIFLFINLFPVILPQIICVFTMLMSITAWIICAVQISKCNDRYGRYSDKGISSKSVEVTENGKIIKPKKIKKYKVKAKYWVKYLISMLIPLFVLIINPVQDSFYYGASIIGLILVIWSFYDLVKIHNVLVSRPIPQLEKRGGDENE